jgi:cell division protein FtsI (penicillin-binding protein 3)
MKSAVLKAQAPIVLPSWRASMLVALLGLLFLVLIGRSVYLQAINTGFLQSQGNSRFSRVVEIPAHRGRITDRHGEPLAISTPVKSLWAFPEQIEATPEQWEKFAALLESDPGKLRQRVVEGGEFLFLKRALPPEVAERAMSLRIKGIYEQREYRRYYPAGEVAAHLVGITDIDDNGQEGIELGHQAWLGGKSGSRRVIINRRGDAVEDLEGVRRPQEGRELALSIDLKLQYLAYRELQAAVTAHRAKAGGVVVLDAVSGEILALANLPSYNPNNRAKLVRDKTRNRALTDTFEPGSTLKPFTIAAALEARKIRPDTLINTTGGRLQIGPATIHDAHVYEALTVEQVIQKSSNVGSARIALSLPAETLWRTLAQAGFGNTPQTGFPGEVAGRLRPAKNWRPIEQATIAYGHGISVNLVQLARAYTVFANDGDLKPVSLLKTAGPGAGQPMLSRDTALAVRKMLEMAVQASGTAPKAQVPGYRVAGKTGTAHKVEGNGYAPNKYVSSFVGLAPASNPRLIVAVMLDEPSAGQHYGGAVAAPVFSKIMEAALRALAIPGDGSQQNLLLPGTDAIEVREET